MTQEEVFQILGEPRGRHAASWSYSRPMAWPIVYIHFDANGRVERHEYDY